MPTAVEDVEGVAVGDYNNGLILMLFFQVVDDTGHTIPNGLEIFNIVVMAVDVSVGEEMGCWRIVDRVVEVTTISLD